MSGCVNKGLLVMVELEVLCFCKGNLINSRRIISLKPREIQSKHSKDPYLGQTTDDIVKIIGPSLPNMEVCCLLEGAIGLCATIPSDVMGLAWHESIGLGLAKL
jgi:hypothetical protein